MTKVTLYYTIRSPPSRTVLLVAKAIGLELELKKIDLLKGEHLTPEFHKINPQHTVPVIVDNGVPIYDSHAIAAYLCDTYAKDDALFPKDPVKRAHINARLHFETGYLFGSMNVFYDDIFVYGESEPSVKVLNYFKKCWDIMERFLENGKFLCGDDLSIADISCIATLTSMDTFLPIEEAKYPKLTKWIETMKEFPFYEVNKQGAEGVQEFIWNKVKANKEKK